MTQMESFMYILPQRNFDGVAGGKELTYLGMGELRKKSTCYRRSIALHHGSYIEVLNINAIPGGPSGGN